MAIRSTAALETSAEEKLIDFRNGHGVRLVLGHDFTVATVAGAMQSSGVVRADLPQRRETCQLQRAGDRRSCAMQGEADATLKELWWLLGDERNLFLIVGLHRGIALRRHFLLSRMFRRMAGIEPRELRFERGHLWLLGPSSDQD